MASEYADRLLTSKRSQEELVERIIEKLIEDGHLDVAADLLFSYRGLISEEKFKDFSAEILMKMKERKSYLDE